MTQATYQRPFPNFLNAWSSYYNGTNLPQQFITWAGLFTIASHLQDFVTINEGSTPLNPNLFVWLLAPPGTAKSEVAKPAMNIIKSMPFVDLYDGQLTSLYLYRHMQSQMRNRAVNSPSILNPRISIYSDELAATLGNSQMTDDLVKSLTVMYSGSYKYGTGKHGLIDIEKPVINWLACCSPSWLRRSIPRDYLDSGFIARIVTVYEPLRLRYKLIKYNDSLRLDLIRDLARIANLRGEFKLTKDAQALRDRWEDTQFTARLHLDEITQGIYGREGEHALKVAMCIAASRGNDLVITEQCYQNSASIVLAARSSSLNTLLSIISTPQGQAKMYLLSTIEKGGRIAQTDLRLKTYKRIDDNIIYYRLIEALVNEGSVAKLIALNGKGVAYEITPSGRSILSGTG